MRALLICPEFPLSFWSLSKTSRLTGCKALLPPLGLLTVAALLPSTWELRLADLNTTKLTNADWQCADLILISAMYIQKDGLWALTREAKQRGKTVVAGGPYPTSMPEEVLAAGCDFVVRGEGENTIPLLLEAMKNGQAGIVENLEKPDLTASPIPRFDLLRLNDYRSMAIQTSRGCPFDCEFCDVVNLFGHTLRHKTPGQVIVELETLYRLKVAGDLFICDDNFIGSKRQARTLLQELGRWSKERGKPFNFMTQASVNLGQDLEMMNLMTEANLGEVFIGIESPDKKVLETSHKYHNLKDSLTESVNNLKNHGIAVFGSFIIGLDGETAGAGRRIGAFMEQTDMAVAMLGMLQASPHTKLWDRLRREGRLRDEVGLNGGTFAALNYDPDRPEIEIMEEYAEAWEQIYEPSRYLKRAYRNYLAMPPPRRSLTVAREAPPSRDSVSNHKMTWRQRFYEVRALLMLIWWQGIRAPYRRQFWRQLLGMWRQNPGRFTKYLEACAIGEDLFEMRRTVRAKVAANMQERWREADAGASERISIDRER